MARKKVAADHAEIVRVAREKCGFDHLRPGQEQVIQRILDGRDTLSVMPTGSGKSAIYQIAGLMIDGPTVIVSPLIALQKDQVESIEEKDLAPAAVVNSTQRVGERREAFKLLDGGELEFLFLAPEQFANEETMARLMENKPSLFVVDEAHCISEWGHDFRPEYARLGTVIDALGHPPVLALTATAAPTVADDIRQRLNMRNGKTIVWGFDRPNIWLAVEACPDESTKQRLVVDRVRDMERPAIVYVATHGHAEAVCKQLQDANVKATYYHGGMKKDERCAAQDDFMADRAEVVVATNAFGMGVDKPDVRTVIHYDVSESVDSYYQEVGRAGRDGKPARALLLYRPEDIGARKAMAAGGKLKESQVEEVAELIEGRADPVNIKELKAELKEQSDIGPIKVAQTINRLEEAGAVEVLPGGEVVATAEKIDTAAIAEVVVRDHETYRRYRQGRVELMKDYAETRDCRRRYLLNYFGEAIERPCGFCDNCETGEAEKVEAKTSDLPFPLKARVNHKKWSGGVIMRYDEDKVVIQFDKVGEKSLVTQFVIDNELIEVT